MELSDESFHITQLMEMELVSKKLDCVIDRTWLSARENFINLAVFGHGDESFGVDFCKPSVEICETEDQCCEISRTCCFIGSWRISRSVVCMMSGFLHEVDEIGPPLPY
jgi:hypothetical protein